MFIAVSGVRQACHLDHGHSLPLQHRGPIGVLTSLSSLSVLRYRVLSRYFSCRELLRVRILREPLRFSSESEQSRSPASDVGFCSRCFDIFFLAPHAERRMAHLMFFFTFLLRCFLFSSSSFSRSFDLGPRRLCPCPSDPRARPFVARVGKRRLRTPAGAE